MKKIYTFITLASLLISTQSFSQGMWTWMSGTTSGTPVFGTQGVPSIDNVPPSGYGTYYWKDLNGNFWTFAGNGGYADVWKFNPLTLEWTWVKGNGNFSVPAVYGVEGVSSPLNTPGSRGFCSLTWTDLNGDLWLYGGYEFGSLGDLWKYSIATNEWTWMSGVNTVEPLPVYGTIGVASDTISPGGRCEGSSGWVDACGRLYMFSSYTNLTTNNSDMWAYNPLDDTWTVTSSDLTTTAAVYGPHNVFGPTYFPGARSPHGTWTDDVVGDFWVFGGIDWSGSGSYGDLWRYDPDLSQWAWVSGAQGALTASVAGAACQFDSAYHPSSRYENRATWRDLEGNLWLYGGFDGAFYSDMWVYNMDCNRWARMQDSNFSGTDANYGTMGLASPTNTPGSLVGTATWVDNSGNFWLFGGGLQGFLGVSNAMWKYEPDLSCMPACDVTLEPNMPVCDLNQQAQISGDTILCEGESLILNANGDPDYWWSISTNPNDTISTNAQLVITNPSSGVYILHGDSSVDSVQVFVSPLPIVDLGNDTSICQNESITLNAGTQNNYLWSNGSTTQSITATLAGDYSVTVTNSYGCTARDTIQLSILALPTVQIDDAVICSGNSVTLSATSGLSYEWQDGSTNQTFTATSTGTYVVTITNANGCTASDAATVTALAPTVDLGNTIQLCSDQQATLNAGAGFDTYQWSTGATNSSITVNQSGSYAVTVTLQGCPANDSVDVVVFNYPFVTLGNDTTLCSSSSVTLNADSGPYNYLWSTLQTEKAINVNQTGLYSVTVSNQGCSTSDSINVVFIACDLEFPNAFSPNADGLNDIFKAWYLIMPVDFELKIYNRWGQQVYSSTDVNKGWDGTFNGEPCEIDAYAWTCNYYYLNGLQTLSGSVTIIR